MTNRENHEFEYYEEQAAYFQYTHAGNWDDECEADSLNLHVLLARYKKQHDILL